MKSDYKAATYKGGVHFRREKQNEAIIAKTFQLDLWSNTTEKNKTKSTVYVFLN